MGDLIWETDRGRPLGMSTVRLLSRRDSLREECLSRDDEDEDEEYLEDVECLEELFSLSEEWCFEELDLDDDLLDLSWGTSRMFKTRPVVGSVVEDCPGSWETWYPSMM